MRVVHAVTEVDMENPTTVEKRREIQANILANLNAPIELYGCTKVSYDHRSDRYTVTFCWSEKTVTLKTTNQIAEFVTANIGRNGYWLGRMEDGLLVDIYLITVN